MQKQMEQMQQQNPQGGFPMGEGFLMGAPPMDGFPMGGGFPMGAPPMGNGQFQFDPIGMFAAYRVSSYEEEIAILKKWFADRLAFLDQQIDRFDQDWEPRIQPLIEKRMEFPNGNFPFPGEFPFPIPKNPQ